MKTLAEEFVLVIERQLSDFLPDGKYGMPPSDEDRQRMSHCQLTNLVGEACFADLDYSMFKNRRASLHHRRVKQAQLLSRARKLGPQMCQTDRKQELIVLQELRNAMDRKRREEHEEHARKEEKLRKLKENIIQCVTHQGDLARVQMISFFFSKNRRHKLKKLRHWRCRSTMRRYFLGLHLQSWRQQRWP